jgi:hypothetical protein
MKVPYKWLVFGIGAIAFCGLFLMLRSPVLEPTPVSDKEMRQIFESNSDTFTKLIETGDRELSGTICPNNFPELSRITKLCARVRGRGEELTVNVPVWSVGLLGRGGPVKGFLYTKNFNGKVEDALDAYATSDLFSLHYNKSPGLHCALLKNHWYIYYEYETNH